MTERETRPADRDRDRETRPAAEGERLDAPNQQVVRPDGSGPADEGSGGSGGKAKKGQPGRPAAPAGRPAGKAQDEPSDTPRAQKGS